MSERRDLSDMLRGNRTAAAVALSMIVCVLSAVYAILPLTVDPLSPSESLFAATTTDKTRAEAYLPPDSTDFSTRPLFTPKRRNPKPKEDEQDASQSTASGSDAPVEEEFQQIEGITLLGIFNSGDVSGAIVRLDKAGQRRVEVGETVKGWELMGISSRRAVFGSLAGDEGALELQYSSDQEPMLDGLSELSANGERYGTSVEGSGQDNSGGQVAGSEDKDMRDGTEGQSAGFTFADMYKIPSEGAASQSDAGREGKRRRKRDRERSK